MELRSELLCETCSQWTFKMLLNFMANSFVFGRINCQNVHRTFLQSLQGENFQNASQLNSKLLHLWTHKSLNCAQNFFCKTRRKITSKMHLYMTANSFVFGRIKCGIALRTFFIKLAWRKLPKMHLNPMTNSFVFGQKNRENASRTFFINLARQRTSKMCLNFTANRFVFGCTNREIAPRTLCAKLAGRELPKCV